MIENRRRKFIGNLVNDEILIVVHSVMTFNMCFICVLILVFFRPPPKKNDHGSPAPSGDIGIDATDNML